MGLYSKYGKLFNEYATRMNEENLTGEGKCSISIKISEILFAIVHNVDGKKPIDDSDIIAIGMVNESSNKEEELHRLTYLTNKSVNAVIHAYPEYSSTVADARVVIPPMLDDMAQIIGRNAKFAENNNNAIMKVLAKRNACMIVGNGVITYGRSLDEAYTACLVLEKSAKCLIDTTVLGGYKKINIIEAVLMHIIYQKKYSKLNQEQLNAQISEDKTKVKIKTNDISEKEMQLRKAVKDAGVRLLKSNLVQGTWGNISIRLDDEHMLITPSGLDYLSLQPEDMVVMNFNTMEYKGDRKPSGEKDIHAGLLRERKDINVVMHSHPTECSALSAAGVDLPIVSEEMKKYVKGIAKVSSYALPSTKKLAEATIKAMEGINACLMANHGMLSVGSTIDETFETCRVMEESAKIYIDQLADKQSSIKGDSKEKRKDIFRKKYNS